VSVFIDTLLLATSIPLFNLPFAYVGGLGPESLPYLWALLGLVGSAFVAIIQWPLFLLFRRRKTVKNELKETPTPGEQIKSDKA
jgi:hypothetical protein